MSVEIESPEPSAPPSGPDRIALMMRDYFDVIWRTARRLGLTHDEAEDAAQQSFIVASKRISDILPGSERAFLLGTVTRVSSDIRRSKGRRGEVAVPSSGGIASADPTHDDVLDGRRAREVLDGILDEMPADLRSVFVLYEVEELTMAEIAVALEIPPGTVASRLRRSRDDFHARVARIKARMKGGRHE